MGAQGAPVLIVGAGLAGLYAAWLLERQGFRDYLVLEAREAPGGRIASFEVPGPGADGTATTVDRFDLGPAWYWPAYQRDLHRLVEELGLEGFAQFETGDTVIERTPDSEPERMRGMANAPPSVRLSGGMGALVDALRHVPGPRLVTGQAVQALRCTDDRVELDSTDTAGKATTWHAGHVLLAVPPRLAAQNLSFEPALPQVLAAQWRATPTWMAPHAKYIAVYDAPFWREHGLSGEGRSARGPMAEIHDASLPGGSAALFGFLGVPARVRGTVPGDVLRAHCRAQLARLFGERAATPRAEAIKDWALDPHTATLADRDPATHHAMVPAATAASGPWHGRLVGIASEWSPQFPGYVAGAIEAADLGVRDFLQSTSHEVPQ